MPTILGFMNINTNIKFDGRDLSSHILANSKPINENIPIWNYEINIPKKRNWRDVVTNDYTFPWPKSRL